MTNLSGLGPQPRSLLMDSSTSSPVVHYGQQQSIGGNNPDLVSTQKPLFDNTSLALTQPAYQSFYVLEDNRQQQQKEEGFVGGTNICFVKF